MKQLLQNLQSGKTELVEEPVPRLKSGHVLVQTRASLISAGTERMLVEFGKAGYIPKAKSQPDLVRKVINTARKEGLATMIQKVQSKLNTPIPLRYSCAGIVREVGEGVDEFQVGDWVACGGAGYADHAEFNVVPKNLCVRLPERLGQPIPPEEAAFDTIGTIAL